MTGIAQLGIIFAPVLAPALIAIGNLVFAALMTLSALEGLTLAWLVLRSRRNRLAHWALRPLAWSVGLALGPLAAFAANLFILFALLKAEHFILAFVLPFVMGAPVLGVLLVLAASAAWRQLRALRAPEGDMQQAARAGGRVVAAVACVMVGVALMAAAILGGVGAIAVAVSGDPEAGAAAGAFGVMAALCAAGAVPLWRLGRAGGRLRPAPAGAVAASVSAAQPATSRTLAL